MAEHFAPWGIAQKLWEEPLARAAHAPKNVPLHMSDNLSREFKITQRNSRSQSQNSRPAIKRALLRLGWASWWSAACEWQACGMAVIQRVLKDWLLQIDVRVRLNYHQKLNH
jgi:hypothetical protein